MNDCLTKCGCCSGEYSNVENEPPSKTASNVAPGYRGRMAALAEKYSSWEDDLGGHPTTSQPTAT